MAEPGTVVLHGVAPPARAPGQPVRGRVAASDRSPDDPGGRGSLVIKDRVATRIAAAAARRVPGVAPSGTGTSGVGAALGRSYPRVEAEIVSGRIRARVEIACWWPTPSAALAVGVRSAVAEQLHELTGLQVDAVDVTIAKIVRVGAEPARRVR